MALVVVAWYAELLIPEGELGLTTEVKFVFSAFAAVAAAAAAASIANLCFFSLIFADNPMEEEDVVVPAILMDGNVALEFMLWETISESLFLHKFIAST